MTPADAFYEGAALIDMSDRGRISAKGEDRKRLLHAITTNHIQNLEVGQGLYAFFLNAQGRVLADGIVLCREDDLILTVEPEVRTKVFEHIDRYIIADDVVIEDVTETTKEFALEGPAATSLLQTLGCELPAEPYHFTQWGDRIVVRATSTGMEGFRIVTDAGDDHASDLTQAGAVAASWEIANVVRIENGTPRYGVDITESYIAQETQQAHALHFDKGCYLGQEIVERVRSRGHVNRLLTPLRIQGEAVPSPGAKVKAGEQDVGEITSAAFSIRQGCVRALAYVRAQALGSGAALSVEGAVAEAVHRGSRNP